MKNEKFDYTYYAPTEEERKEISAIKRQYMPAQKNQSKLERLKRLDSRVKNTANALSLCLGIVGCLIFGLGLTIVLEWAADITLIMLGVITGAAGCGAMALAYPIYKLALNLGKKKYGAEILRLSNELLGDAAATND